MKYCVTCKAKYEDTVGFCPVDGEVLEDDLSAIVNTVLDGQYQVESLLGKGGMGAVYRARHILLGDRVAIKILPPEVRTNAEWLRRFQREGQAARRFRHPNAVTVYDLRTSGDGTVYMVMEYVEGHTLGDEIKRRGRFTPAEAIEVLEPIMSVLHTAHAMGVVHRDLKPDNIMIGNASTGERTVKLLDLGIAKMREIAGGEGGGNTALTMAGQVLGTPHYMSPEQWGELPRDGDSEIDGRADIYSLGIVVYEMIVGKRPYSGQTLHELRREHISVVVPPVDGVVPNVPRAFGEAITRATAKDRGDRFATAGDFAANLSAAVHSTDSVIGFDRTLPDLPHIQDSNAHTEGIAPAPDTKSDVDAATILTLDSPVTAPVKEAGTRPQGNAGRPVAPGLMDSGIDAPSLVTIPQQPRPRIQANVPGHEQPQVAKSKIPWLVLAAVGLVILLIVGVGGFFAVKKFTGSSTATGAVVEKSTGTNGAVEPVTGPLREVAQYWLELLPESLLGEPVRVAGAIPLASEQSFKFHFVFNEDGYLYIVGPGELNKPTAFLTAKPASLSGLETNQVARGSDFSFPEGLEHWLRLDKKAGTEDYTIIFSSTPLPEPAFLSAEATGRPLSETEHGELTTFLAKHKTADPITEINDKDGAQPFVAVKAPRAEASSNPIVFRIRIQHK
ncbi:MAG: protein kinase domain-containing protein [Pyrinomonadaceae bacterium]